MKIQKSKRTKVINLWVGEASVLDTTHTRILCLNVLGISNH